MCSRENSVTLSLDRRTRRAQPFDRELFLASLHPELRAQLERRVEPTPHHFTVNAVGRGTKTPRRRTHYTDE